MHFTIDEHEFKYLPKTIQKRFKEYEDLEQPWLLVEKDRAATVKKLIKKYAAVIKKNKGAESSEECHYLSSIVYMLEHMYAYEICKLKLEKLLKK
jgi:DNA-binding transcriptional regulator PaaX